mmetsp:Transcript_1297/g.2636  ORF Transcript_1297/g.2636 Transcript_1297/m.2636 type:complete len:150 (+) Transcript_1297:1414-1863(+)
MLMKRVMTRTWHWAVAEERMVVLRLLVKDGYQNQLLQRVAMPLLGQRRAQRVQIPLQPRAKVENASQAQRLHPQIRYLHQLQKSGEEGPTTLNPDIVGQLGEEAPAAGEVEHPPPDGPHVNEVYGTNTVEVVVKVLLEEEGHPIVLAPT